MTNKILLSTLTSLFLTSDISAKDLLQDLTCGSEFNLTNFTTPTTDSVKECSFTPIKQTTIKQIRSIKNYEELFRILNIKSPYQLYHDRIYSKLLDDIYINQYTHTYLFYKKVINYKQHLNKIKENNKTVISHLDLGGIYIGLIHIKSKSQDEYTKISKKLPKKILNFSNINHLESIFNKLSKNHAIVLKEFITDRLEVEKSYDLRSFFKNIKTFEHAIKGANKIIDFTIANQKKLETTPILKQYDIKNNLFFIKTHPQQFHITDAISYAKLHDQIIRNLDKMIRNDKEQDLTIPSLTYPKRYQASLDIKPIDTKPFNYQMKNNLIPYPYQRINKDTIFSFTLQLHMDIKHHGKVLIETINTTLKENNKLLAKDKESHIKFDTFVNFPKLRFSKIKNYNFGEIESRFIFDKYQKEKKIKGTGIIKEATCGYTLDLNHQLHFQCNNITLKPIDIEFKHE